MGGGQPSKHIRHFGKALPGRAVVGCRVQTAICKLTGVQGPFTYGATGGGSRHQACRLGDSASAGGYDPCTESVSHAASALESQLDVCEECGMREWMTVKAAVH